MRPVSMISGIWFHKRRPSRKGAMHAKEVARTRINAFSLLTCFPKMRAALCSLSFDIPYAVLMLFCLEAMCVLYNRWLVL